MLAVVAVLAATLTAALVLSLRAESVRRGLLRWAGGKIERETGVRVTARDFSLSLVAGVLEVEDITLGVPSAGVAPFLSLPRARAEFAWRPLLEDRVELRKLEIMAPRFDLGAPLPEAPSVPSGQDTEPQAWRLDILDLEVMDASIRGGPAPPEAEVVLDSWAAEAVHLGGSYRDDQLELGIRVSHLVAESSRRPPVEGELVAVLSRKSSGRLILESMELSAPGLQLAASGQSRSGESGSFAGSFELDAALNRLFPDLTGAGELHAAGELGLDTSSGRVLRTALQAEVTEFPGELLRPWLRDLHLEGLKVAGTHLDLLADLDSSITLEEGVDALGPDAVAGRASVSWRSGEERLLTADLEFQPSGQPAEIGMAFSFELLPELRGRRRMTGTLLAPSWLELEAGEVRGAELDFELPDVETAAGRLGLTTTAFAAWLPAGGAEGSLRVDGPLMGPALRLEVGWRQRGEQLLRLTARTRQRDGLEGLVLDVNGSLLPDAPGQRVVSGRLVTGARGEFAAGSLEDGRLDLDVPDLAAALSELGRRAPAALQVWFESLKDLDPAGELFVGRLRAEVRARGVLTQPEVDLHASWRLSPGEMIRLDAGGRALLASPHWSGPAEAELRLEHLDLSRWQGLLARGEAAGQDPPPELGGSVTGSLRLHGSPESYLAAAQVDGSDLAFGTTARVPRLHLEATTDGEVLELPRFSGELSPEPPFRRPLTFAAHGAAKLERPLRSAEIRLELKQPVDGFDLATATGRLEGGTLRILVEALASDHPEPARIDATVPLGALHTLPTLGKRLAALPVAADQGAVEVGLAAVRVESLLPLLEASSDVPSTRATVDGSLTFDPSDLFAAQATVEISNFVVEQEDGALAATAPVRLSLENGAVTLAPTRLEPRGRVDLGSGYLELAGSLELNPAWEPEQNLRDLVAGLDAELTGTLDGSFLGSLAGGVLAGGSVTFGARARGPLSSLSAELSLDGPGASLRFPLAYETELESPHLALRLEEGEAVIETARVKLNEGDVRLTGGMTRSDGLDLQAEFTGVRYLLDHGLLVLLSGDLQLTGELQKQPRLSGRVVLDQGVVRRDIDLGREVVALLGQPEFHGSGQGVLDDIELDVDIHTGQGIRVSNNLGDLRGDWSSLRVRGTLDEPRISGRIDIDPGGQISLSGQRRRIENASITLTGDPSLSPRVVLRTSAVEDDQGWGQAGAGGASVSRSDPLDVLLDDVIPGAERTNWDQIVSDLGVQFGGLFVGGLTSRMGPQLTIQPQPILGETDNQARLTATQRLSANAALIASVNPREAEGQTYILEIQDLPIAPGVKTQIFTNDEDHEGATVQRRHRLGARRGERRTPNLHKVRFDLPGGIPKRRLHGALGYRRGGPFPEFAAFEVQAGVAEELRKRGYPGASVSVEERAVRKRRVDLEVAVDLGPRVLFEFAGEELPRGSRRSIRLVYLPGANEEAATEALEEETVRALRAEGFLDPLVRLAVDRSEDPTAHSVRVETAGGRKIDPGVPRFQGVPADVAALLEPRFLSRLSRVALAAEDPGAQRYLELGLRRVGYPDARILSTQLSADGKSLTVAIDPGSRQQVGSIEITGVEPREAGRLLDVMPLRVGDFVEADTVSQAVQAIENDLQEKGYATARVEVRIDHEAAHDSARMALRFEVDPGPVIHVDEIRFEGLRSTSPTWAAGTAGVEEGELLREQVIGEARRNLAQTGVFRSIRSSTQVASIAGPGEGSGGEPAAGATLTFELEEEPRYGVAYGGRWESDEGFGAVVDAADYNFLGRGQIFGARGVYSEEEQSLRLFHAWPRALGPGTVLETFVERQEEVDGDFLIDGTQLWVQLGFPLSRRLKNRVYFVFADRVLQEELADGTFGPGERLVSPGLGYQISFDGRTGTLGENRRGTFAGLDFLGADQSLGSDFTAYGLFGHVKRFDPLGHGRRLTWAQSLRGSLLEVRGDRNLPRTDRLRAGGQYSVRGYPTESLGPLDEDGDPLGGEVLLVINEELHFPLKGNVRGLIFLDVGNVWESRQSIDSMLFKSIGAGLRVNTFTVPLRLDVAFPLDRRDGDPSYKVYLGFGNIF